MEDASLGRLALWLDRGSGLAEGLAGLAEGIGQGLIPVVVRAAGAKFPGALLAQSFGHGRADQLGEHRRLGYAGGGGALDYRGSIRPGGSERPRDHVEGKADPDAVTAPLKAADGMAAELERAGRVVKEERDRGGPNEVAAAVIAERGTELAAFVQAGPGPAGVGAGDGRAD